MRDPADRLEALVSVGRGGARARPERAGLLLLGPARARRATGRASSGAPRARGAACDDLRAAALEAEPEAADADAMSAQTDASTRAIRSVAVYTHRRREVTSDIVQMLTELARRLGVELRFDRDETIKHALESHRRPGVEAERRGRKDADVCIVLGGDGTTLRALRAHAGHRRAGLLDQLRPRRVPRDGRPRRSRRGRSSAR